MFHDAAPSFFAVRLPWSTRILGSGCQRPRNRLDITIGLSIRLTVFECGGQWDVGKIYRRANPAHLHSLCPFDRKL